MSAELGAQPHRANQKPPEWDNLIDFAADKINPNLPAHKNDAAAEAVWTEVGNLPVEQREANRYYGLWLAANDFAPTVITAEGQERLINSTVRTWVNNQPFYAKQKKLSPEQGLYLGELQAPLGRLDHSFRDRYGQRPLHERLVINSLTVMHRAYRVHNQGPRPWREALDDHQTASDISNNSLAGASRLMRLALMGLGNPNGHYLGQDDPNLIKALVVNELADPETIAKFDLTRVSVRAAALRGDEMNAIEEKLKLDHNSHIYIDPRDIPKDAGKVRLPSRPDLPKIRHEQRLGCPALYVGGLVPLVARSMPRMVTETQAVLLDANYNGQYII